MLSCKTNLDWVGWVFEREGRFLKGRVLGENRGTPTV